MFKSLKYNKNQENINSHVICKHINFVMGISINFVGLSEKEFILMGTWIVGKDLMKHYQIRKND